MHSGSDDGAPVTLGVGTLLYGLAAGISIAFALVFLFIAVQRRGRGRLFIAFGAFGTVMAVTTVVTLLLHTSSSVVEYADRLKLFGLASLLSLLATFGLVMTWTQAVSRHVATVFVGASVVIATLQVILPVGLLADDVTLLRTVSFFGEEFVVHDAGTSPWRPVLDVYLVGMLVALGVALWRGARQGRKGEAMALTFGLAAFLAFSQYDSLVDEGLVDTPYLAPFGATMVVVVGGWFLASRVVTAERRLETQSRQLEETVIDRTAALIESNDQLELQLAHQRESVRRLAALAEQFEKVNALALEHEDPQRVQQALLEVLADLGGLLGADAVTMRIAGGSAAVPDEIAWPAPATDRRAATTAGSPRVEAIAMGPREIGELVVHPPDGHSLDDEERRYVELTSDHLAGFLHRLELSRTITETAVDAERHRIARELHDSVTQKLYSVSYLAEALPRQLDDSAERPAATVRRMRELLLSSLAELRTLLFELQPAALEAASLPQLVEQLVETFDASSDVAIEAAIGPLPAMPVATKVDVYRIAQEAISNALRHSGADRVTLDLGADDETIELVVQDRGGGFDQGANGGGHGLRNMRDRASALSATLDVDTAVGAGTTVTLRWTPETCAAAKSEREEAR